jgi:hypothetical protein
MKSIDESKGLPVDWLLLMSDDSKRSRRRRAPSSTTFSSWSGTADFVVQRVLLEFRSEASRILSGVVALDFSAGIHLHELISERLERIVNCACSLSGEYLSAMLAGLLRWRETQTFDGDRVKARVESATVRISLKDAMLLLDERHGCAVAYLFAFTALRLLDALLLQTHQPPLQANSNPIVDSVALQIETIIFEVLRGGGGAPSATSLASGKKLLINIGILVYCFSTFSNVEHSVVVDSS